LIFKSFGFVRLTNPNNLTTDINLDDDGMSDTFERVNGLDPYTFTDPYADSDRDGMADVEEAAVGTNPNLRDSDGDGLDDYAEWSHGSDADVGVRFVE
jgi:Bacterial TSP3 repeat